MTRALLGALTLLLLLPSSAAAGTASVGPRPGTPALTNAFYAAAPGETNRLTVTVTGFTGDGPPANVTGTVTFRDSAGVAPGPGCVRPAPGDPTVATCAIAPPAHLHEIGVALGDRDDAVAVISARRDTVVLGGPGNDVLTGGASGDDLDGGPGADTLDGRAGLDILRQGIAPDGADVLRGGAGFDTLDYSRRTAPVRALIGGDPNAKPGAEGDAVEPGIERIRGGAGADVLKGAAGYQELRGGRGRDYLVGGRGIDKLVGGPGRSGDHLYGGPGGDDLLGGPGPDVLEGGTGVDSVSGFGGADLLLSGEGDPDSNFCGRGRDRVDLDRFDFVDRSCEVRPRRRRAAPVLLYVTGFAEETASFAVLVGCPADGPNPCRVRVEAFVGKRRISRDSRTIARGRRRFAGIGLNADTVGLLAGGRRVRIVMTGRDRRGRRVVRRLTERLSSDFP